MLVKEYFHLIKDISSYFEFGWDKGQFKVFMTFYKAIKSSLGSYIL